MTILLAAVDGGTLSAASRQLHIPLATVSRRVSELEEHLNARLLLRGSRKLTLTDAGRDYVASCRRILEDIAEAERTAAGEYRAPQGELVMSVPPVIGRIHAMPLVVEFLQDYPDVRVRVLVSERIVNLMEDHIDLAIRVGELPDSTMIAKRVGMIRQVLCASPAYLKSRGMPRKPADLASHDCVAYESYAAESSWEFFTKGKSHKVQIPFRLVVNTGEEAVLFATAGAGIARTFSYQIDDLLKSRKLVTLLEGYEPSPRPVSVIYPGQRQVPLKLRVFLDFAIPRLRERLAYKARSD
jgi:DNA-binding transcriptional LysR family regulator